MNIRKHTLCKMGIHKYRYCVTGVIYPIIEYTEKNNMIVAECKGYSRDIYSEGIKCKYCGKEE